MTQTTSPTYVRPGSCNPTTGTACTEAHLRRDGLCEHARKELEVRADTDRRQAIAWIQGQIDQLTVPQLELVRDTLAALDAGKPIPKLAETVLKHW